MNSANILKPIQGKGKRSKVSAALLALVRGLGPGARLPSFRELCEEMQVAKVTLDQSLALLDARGLIERVQGSGIYVTQAVEQRTIALMMGKDVFRAGSAPVYLQLMEESRLRAASKKEKLITYLDIEGASSRASNTLFHKELEDAINLGMIDGLFLTNVNSLAQEEWLREAGVPFVVCGHGSPHMASIEPDLRCVIEGGIDDLIALGCRELGLIGVWGDDVTAFKSHCSFRGLPVHPEWLQLRSEIGAKYGDDAELKHEELGGIAIHRMFANPEARPSGVICTNDEMARGACLALVSMGLTPGRDVPVVTHANKGSIVLTEWAANLIQYSLDPKRYVESTFALLDDVMAGRLKGRTNVFVGLERIAPAN